MVEQQLEFADWHKLNCGLAAVYKPPVVKSTAMTDSVMILQHI
jgi:hypothetical protein